MHNNPAGIKGLEGREPIAAAVTIGIKKGGSGYPVERDRFHVVNPREADGVRALHPAFASFNAAGADNRKVLLGNLVHASQQACFEYQLKAQVIGSAHPDRKPACVGDGIHAVRWEGPDPDDFMQIKCPNERCEFRLTEPPKCKPFARLLFRLRWQDGVNLPTPLVKYTTGSWNTTANLLGFFEHIDRVARELGLEQYTLFGFPFILTLQDQTKASTKSRFPVVHISPEQDPVQFFMAQRQNIAQLQQQHLVALPELQDTGEVYEDVQSINVPEAK